MRKRPMMDIRPFRADLHIHSCLSPCGGNDMTPPAVIERLKTLEVDIFSITDHNGCGNVRGFTFAAEKQGLLMVPGIELQSSEEVHVLGYFQSIKALEGFVDEFVNPFLTPGKNSPETFGEQILVDQFGREKGQDPHLLTMPLQSDLETLVKQIRDTGGLAVPAHLDKNFSVISQLGFIPPNLEVDAFEIYMLKKMRSFKDELSSWNVPILSSSDAHHPHHLIKPKMKFRLKGPTLDEVFKAVREKDERKITLDLLA